MHHGFFGYITSMRQRRKIKHGAKYHVMARANRKEMIFGSRALKAMFLDVVKRARKKYKFAIQNFCIMGNHFHLILEPLKGESLSKIMQWILSVFAMKYNNTFNYKGHVFYDRFKSKIIGDFRHYVATFIYITKNPVKAGIVKDPNDFEFNGVNFLKKGLYDVINPPSLFIRLLLPGISCYLIS
jgi:putative transposase